MEVAYECKSLKYAELATDLEQRGWKANVCPVEVGCGGFIGRSSIKILKDLGIQRPSPKTSWPSPMPLNRLVNGLKGGTLSGPRNNRGTEWG